MLPALLVGAALAASPAPTEAVRLPQDPPVAPPVPAPDRLALTISGGATLGVHEAGVIYMLGQAAARLEPGPSLALATGASAGSGNTLLSVLALCAPLAPDPSESLGWELWVDNGLDALTPPEHASPVALFSQDAMFDQRERLREAWHAGLREDCDVTLAIPVTRLESVDVEVAPDLRFPRQTLRFVVRVEGRGPGQPPRLHTVRDPASHQLPLTGDPDADLDRLWQVMVASAAFPFAFEPVSIGFCTPESARCDAAEQTAWFIDGGVFDNVPLRMAHRLTAEEPGVRHVYLDPAIRAYPEPADDAVASTEVDLTGYLSAFMGGFVGQARSHEVFALAEHDPEVVRATHVGRSRFPQAGAHLNNFFGVFDRDLRVFDFTLGMYDAWHELDALAGPGAQAALAGSMDRPGWRRLACLRGWADDQPALRASCAGEDLGNFRALVGTALARTWSACRVPGVADRADASHHVCAAAGRAAEGGAPGAAPGLDAQLLTLLPGLSTPEALLRGAGESDLEHTLRLLEAGGYAWNDLGLEADEAHRAAGVMADRLARSVRTLARAQGDPVRARLLAAGGEQALAAVLAAPTDPRGVYALGGTVAEIGASQQLSRRTPWLRLHGAVQGDGLVSALTRDAEELSISPALGLELDPRPRSTRLARPVVGARMSWQLGAPDGAGSRACDPLLDPRLCSQGVVQGFGAVTILGVFRTQVEVDLHPWLPHDGARYDLQIAVGPSF